MNRLKNCLLEISYYHQDFFFFFLIDQHHDVLGVFPI